MASMFKKKRPGRKDYYRVRWTNAEGIVKDRDFAKRKDAEAWLNEVGKDRHRTDEATTIRELAALWLEHHVKPRRSIGTYNAYETSVRLRINPGLGHLRVDRVTPRQVADWVERLHLTGYDSVTKTGKPVAAAPVEVPTVNRTIREVKAMVRWARSRGFTTCRAFDDAPTMRDTRTSSERRSQPTPYTPQQVDQLVRACNTLMEAAIIRVGAGTGLRRTELFALHWESVNLKTGYVSVTRALAADGRTFKPPKVYEERDVPMLEDAWEALKAWREVASGDDLVFHTATGKPLDNTWEAQHAGRYLPDRATGTLSDGIRLRSGIHLEIGHLRDTFVSYLISAGLSVPQITLVIGHQSVETTIRSYAKLLRPSLETIREQTDALVASLRGR